MFAERCIHWRWWIIRDIDSFSYPSAAILRYSLFVVTNLCFFVLFHAFRSTTTYIPSYHPFSLCVCTWPSPQSIPPQHIHYNLCLSRIGRIKNTYTGDLAVEDVPQLVLLTFDDSVNDLNKQLYADLFNKGRVNPNGCPISATFYVSHEWTDYSQVQNLYSEGHEMASHTVS